MGGYNPDGSIWDKPTEEQIKQYKILQDELFEQFGELKVNPHNKYSSKTCPNFDVNELA